MGIAQNVIGMVREIEDRKQAAKVEGQMRNFLTDAEGTIAGVMQIDPATGLQLDQTNKANMAAEQAQKAKTAADRAARVGGAMKYFRGLPKDTDYSQVIGQMTPLFQQLGLDEEDVGALGTLLSTPGVNPDMLDDDGWKAYVKDQYETNVMTPGSHAIRAGEVLHKVPFSMKTVSTRGGDGSSRTDIFDPNTGEFKIDENGVVSAAPPAAADVASAAPMGGSYTVEQLRPHFKAQESSGNYKAKNKESGALGAYQVMPPTGRTMAGRLGLAWRPDMMTQDTPTARRYQDAIGGAVIQEAIDSGEPFKYYFAGSDRKGWGEKTTQYDAEMRARLGEGGGDEAMAQDRGQSTATRTSITMPGKPPKQEKTYRAATPSEIADAGYPTGTAAQVDSTGKFVNIKTPPKPSAAEAKTAKAEKDSARARNDVSDQLAEMINAYNSLEEAGAIVDPRDGTLQNIVAKASSSGIGQWVGGVAGTDSQATRQQINNIRPLLLQGIRKASEMGVRGLDSDKELQFYLQAASDPKSDIISNLSALQVLDTAYGRGDTLKKVLPPELYEAVRKKSVSLMNQRGSRVRTDDPGRSAASNPPKVGEVRRGYRFKGGDPAKRSSWEKAK